MVLYNKQAHTVAIRLPYWLDRQRLLCLVNNQPVDAAPSGNTLLLTGMQPGDTIRLSFPVPETIEHYTVGAERYTATLRGSTVVDLQPRATSYSPNRNKVPFFVRDHLRGTVAPLQTVPRFIAERVLPAY